MNAGRDLLVGAAGVGRQQDLSPLDFPHGAGTSRHQRLKLLSLGLVQFDAVSYIHGRLLLESAEETTASSMGTRMTASFTDKQGQYLAFIYAYTKLHRRSPAEADMQAFFRVTPPTVHRMVVELANRGLIHRRPGESRSIKLLIAPEQIPMLR